MKEAHFTKVQLLREIADANPSADNRTLARLAVRKYKGVWRDLEQARSEVRRIRGASGSKKRKPTQATHPKVDIPLPDDTGWRCHKLPDGIKNWLIISDLHVPYHSPKALKLALEYGRQECDGVLILGDWIDFYQASKFLKDPRYRSVANEIEMAERCLDCVQQIAKPKQIVYKGGNHEARYAKHVMQSCPELYEVIIQHADMSDILGLRKRGIPYIRDKHPIRHEELWILHGHEWGYGAGSAVNASRGMYLKGNVCAVQGHGHRTSEHVEPNLEQVLTTCWSLGCLCDLRPEYAPLNKWNHGFGVLHTGKNWTLENKKIIAETKVV